MAGSTQTGKAHRPGQESAGGSAEMVCVGKGGACNV